jgi:20S proteasome subunit alpha 3
VKQWDIGGGVVDVPQISYRMQVSWITTVLAPVSTTHIQHTTSLFKQQQQQRTHRKTQTSEKTYKLCPHATCTVAGLTADANILIDQARLRAGRYAYQYQEPIPIENLVEHVCNYKQAYTQYGGLRPFGVAFLFAGYDEQHGFQLYQSDPSGNYSGWKATVIGANNQAGKSLLKADYGKKSEGDDEMKTDDNDASEEIEMPDVAEALRLAVKVLNKTMDGAVASADKLELFTMSLDDQGNCVHKILNAKEAEVVIKEVEAETATSGDT